MNETLTPAEAARVLAEASTYESSLRERTQGISWMIWGLVSAGIWMTYGYAALAAPDLGWGYSLLWMPWIVAGGAATGALWRSAALSRPALRRTPTWKMWAQYAVGVVFFTALFLVVPPSGPEFPLVAIGAFWAFLGLANPFRMSRLGVRISVLVGTSCALVGGLLLLSPLGIGAREAIATVVAGGVPLASGLYETTRG
jgi:hypothetical protein